VLALPPPLPPPEGSARMAGVRVAGYMRDVWQATSKQGTARVVEMSQVNAVDNAVTGARNPFQVMLSPRSLFKSALHDAL
jgi:hypothetical protein